LEINAKGADVVFAKTFGNGNGQIRFGAAAAGDVGSLAGFGAVNGNVTINLNDGAAVAWNNLSTGGASGSYFRVMAFQLGTETSTHRTIFSNRLNITGDKTIRSDDGLAAIDGEFSNALSMVTGADAVLTKDGAGTMLLSGTSSAFAGRLHVTEGKLLVSGSLASATTNATYGIKVDGGATLGGGGSIVLSNAAAKMVVNGTLQAGEGLANKTLTLSTNLETGADSVLSFAIKGTNESDHIALAGGTSWLFQVNQKVQIFDIGASDAGGQFALITGLTGFGSYDFSNWQVTTDSPLTGELVYIGSTLYYNAVPEPSTLAVAGLGLGALILTRLSQLKPPMARLSL
jgi:autotransporter-associated beta strand protein